MHNPVRRHGRVVEQLVNLLKQFGTLWLDLPVVLGHDLFGLLGNFLVRCGGRLFDLVVTEARLFGLGRSRLLSR